MIPGAIGPRIFYLRDINDSLALRQQLRPGIRLAVIGAGLIGLEIAAVARKKGVDVLVLELAKQVLTRVCPEVVSEYILSLHESNGVVVKTGIEVSRFEQSLEGVKIYTISGEIFEVDIVSIGIGSIPNAEIAALAGIAVNNGIVVDEFGRSSDPDIFAAGDVAQHFNPVLNRSLRLESWQNAQSQSNAVARTMAGKETTYSEVPWFWTDQYQVNLQIAGSPLKWDFLVMRGSILDKGFTVFQLDAGIPVAAVTVNNGRDMRPAMKMIEMGRTVDPLLLADTSVKLQEFCRN
jgi:3-phenylpropionate/trans-cinnamate dioxygenase ferredoxin reductase subunit